MKKAPVMWTVSLLAISVVTLVLAFSSIVGVELPDVWKRLLGVIDLISLPVLAYTSAKYFKKVDK